MIFSRSIGSLAGLALVALMWVLPFLSTHHRLPIPSFYGEWCAGMLGLGALATLLRREVWQSFELPAIALLPLSLVGLLMLQLALGLVVFPQQGLLGAAYLLWAAFLMVLGSRLRRELGWPRFASLLAWALVAGGVLSALVVLIQQAGSQRWLGQWVMAKLIPQSYGNLGQANHFADYMALAIASLTYLHARQRVRLPVFVLLAALFLFVLALSSSRSSWLYLAAFPLLAMIRPEGMPHRRLLLACLMLLPAFLLVQQSAHWAPHIMGWSAGASPGERLFREVGSVSARWQIWREAWQLFVIAPWLGIGFGQFDWGSFQQAAAQPLSSYGQPAEHAHNVVLHLLAEMGVVAGALVVALPLLWLRRLSTEKVTLETWWLLALLAVLGIHSLLEYPLWYAYFMGIAAVLLGAGEQRMLPLDLQRLGRPAFAVMLLLGAFTLTTLRNDVDTLESWMQRGLQHQVSDQELPEMHRALLRIHRESLLAPFVELVYASSLDATAYRLDQKLALNTSAMRFSPVPALVYKQALLLALKGDQPAALAQLDRAVRAYPNDLRDFVTTTETLQHNGRREFDFLLFQAKTLTKE